MTPVSGSRDGGPLGGVNSRKASAGPDYIPTLDGWRGIAIILVLITHLQAGLWGRVYHNLRWLDLGQHGVGIFFVISGYLITGRLLREEKISLRRFYLRRFFRLMPCAWTYLLSVTLLGVLIRMPIIGRDAIPSIFFFRNYWPTTDDSTTILTVHFWSLSLEEQFYLAWPTVLVLIGRRCAACVAAIGVAACVAFRFVNWGFYNRPVYDFRFEVRADALLLGCLLAFLLRNKTVRAWIERYGQAVFLCCLPMLCWHVYHYQRLIPFTESLVIAIMIACTSAAPASPIAKGFEFKYLRYIGLMSYSLYVWQQLFLMPRTGGLGSFLLPLATLGSWTLIEQPCIRFGKQLEQRWFGARRVAAQPA